MRDVSEEWVPLIHVVKKDRVEEELSLAQGAPESVQDALALALSAAKWMEAAVQMKRSGRLRDSIPLGYMANCGACRRWHFVSQTSEGCGICPLREGQPEIYCLRVGGPSGGLIGWRNREGIIKIFNHIMACYAKAYAAVPPEYRGEE